MARETKLDDLRSKRICDALKAGHSYAAAARAGGVDENTIHNWIARGRAGEQPFLGFLGRVEAANQEAEDRAVRVLTSKFDSDDERIALNAAQWWLERRRPADWGKRAEVEEPLSVEEAERLVEEAASLAKAAKTG